MYAREDSPQPTTTRLAQTSDGMTLAAENVRMHERMNQTTKAGVASALSRNFKFELERKGLNEVTFLQEVRKRGNKMDHRTPGAWLENASSAPKGTHLVVAAEIFGYHDPDSLLAEDHIDKRKKFFAEQDKRVRDQTGKEINKVIEPLAKSMYSSKEDVNEVFSKLQNDPAMSGHLSFLVFWLEDQASRHRTNST